MTTTAGTKGNPEAIPSGASPTFAADLTEISRFFSNGRSFRKVADMSALGSATGMDAQDLAIVDTIRGAYFTYSGSAWVMSGVAQFADASARNSAIPSPVAGMRSRLGTELFDREYRAGAWTPTGPGMILPSAATNGAVSAAGVVTSTAQSLVRVRDAFPTGFQVFRVSFDLTMSAAVGPLIRFAVDATDAATAYDYQRTTALSTTVTTVQDLNQTSGSLSPVGLAARHVGEVLIVGPNATAATAWDASSVATANPMTSSGGKSWVGGQHRTATAYNSFSIFGSSGTITVNRLTVQGVS